MATVTTEYKRAIVAKQYSQEFVKAKSDSQVSAIYDRLVNQKHKG